MTTSILGIRAYQHFHVEVASREYFVIVGAQVDAAGEWRILGCHDDGRLVDFRACEIRLDRVPSNVPMPEGTWPAAPRKCTGCGEAGHNIRTCPQPGVRP